MRALQSCTSELPAWLVVVDATNRRTVLLAGAGILAGLISTAKGEQLFPTKPVRLIVPFPPGQAADTYGRLLAQRLSVIWGQPVYIENKAGGIGIPAMLAAKTSAADGHTLVMATSSTLSINPVLHADLPYSPLRDFIPVSNVVIQPLVLVAHPMLAVKSLKDLVAVARKSSDVLQFASPGQGTAQHMAAELLAARAGIKLQHVPYKGSGPAMADLLGGHVLLMIDSVTSSLPHIQAGKINAIAVTTARRVPQLPDVPTVAESGYPGFEGVGWAGVVAPANTPRELVKRISRDIQQVLTEPGVRAEIIARGGIPDPRSSDNYTKFIQAESDKWAKVAREANIRAEE